MLHQKPRAPRATTWRDVRANAVREGRLNEEAVAAHKRRLIAANIDHALAEHRQAAGLTRAELAARLGIPETHVVRHRPGAQQASREPASLDELRHAVRTLLEGLEPGDFRLQPNAVTITGTHDGDEVTVIVQHFVAQPTDGWAAASGGPTTHSSAWSDTAAQEAHRLGWYVPGFHQEADEA